MELPSLYEIGAGGLMAVVGYFVRMHDKRIDHMEENHAKISADVAANALDAEKRFAKEVTLQSSLARIHDRLDRLPDDILKIVNIQNGKKQ